MDGTYTRFTIGTRWFTTWLVDCELEDRMVTVTRGEGAWREARWLLGLTMSPNLDERGVYRRAREAAGCWDYIETHRVSRRDACVFLDLLNDPAMPCYPDECPNAILGCRDGWSYDFAAYGRDVPTVRLDGLWATFPPGEEPVCERVIAIAERLWLPRW